jgi:hypothetical protein
MPTLKRITLIINDPVLRKKYYYDHTIKIFITIIILNIMRFCRILYGSLILAVNPVLYARLLPEYYILNWSLFGGALILMPI